MEWNWPKFSQMRRVGLALKKSMLLWVSPTESHSSITIIRGDLSCSVATARNQSLGGFDAWAGMPKMEFNRPQMEMNCCPGVLSPSSICRELDKAPACWFIRFREGGNAAGFIKFLFASARPVSVNSTRVSETQALLHRSNPRNHAG